MHAYIFILLYVRLLKYDLNHCNAKPETPHHLHLICIIYKNITINELYNKIHHCIKELCGKTAGYP